MTKINILLNLLSKYNKTLTTNLNASEIYKQNIDNIVTIISIMRDPDNKPIQGLGTGIIYNYNNTIYVLTNNHVITGAEMVKILTNDILYDVDVIGTSSDIDIGVLKVKNYTIQNNIPNIIADPEIFLGNSAMAIGSPYGLDGTITQGIISSVDRYVNENGMVYIQTDAAINPGNSGGPLFNSIGQIIGLNTFIVENAIGLGFAIPASIVLKATNEIIQYGLFRKNYAGLVMNDTLEGVSVVQILEYGPSYNKLQIGDIILEFDGVKITNTAIFRNKILYNSVHGIEYSIKIKRNGVEQNISIMLELKKDIILHLDKIIVQAVNYNIINDINKEHFDNNEITEALEVFGIGDSRQLQIGDIILEINGKRYKSIGTTLEDPDGKDSFKGLLKRSPNPINLSVYRNKKIITIKYNKPLTKNIIRGDIV